METIPEVRVVVRSTFMRRERLVPAILCALGASVAAISIAADLRAGGGDFGLMQNVMVLVGLSMVLHGITLASPPGWQIMAGWWQAAPALRLASIAKFGAISGQLLLLSLVIQRFRVENPAFYEKVVPLCLIGFVIHHLLAPRWRLTFFLALSVSALVAVFGVTNAAWLFSLGLLLAVICHLPIAFGLRVTLLLALGGSLAAMRGGVLPAPWSGAIWAILGSMFMFRLILYMYDLKHSREPRSLTRTLSYFFLLPNVAFPLFPVVDFATFRRTYYDQDAYEIYQRGIRWMVRGVAHLIAYRFVYQHLVISQSDVTTSVQLAQYLIANFLLYLRVSGQFHLIVGMLHLFGFRLPETHRFFYMSSSFTDFWRRINIYWKDFMMKVVYYPTYFRLKKHGATVAMVVSTLAVFVVTWFLHAYQWFWLLGRFLLSWTDVLFWSILAVLLVANSLYEVRKGRKRVLGQNSWTVKHKALLAVRITATFLVLCTLWSLWTSPTLKDWFALWTIEDLNAWKVTVAVSTVLIVVFVSILLFGRRMEGEDANRAPEKPLFFPGALSTAIVVIALYTLGSPALSAQLGPRAQEMIRDLKVTELNKSEASMLQRGYYEELVGVNRFNGQLWEVYSSRPQLWRMPTIETTGAARWLDSYLRIELRPLVGTPYLDGTFRTNRWGMRDRDYEKQKPASAYRVALMGPSHVAGWGVSDFEVFDNLVEDRLNGAAQTAAKYEILNFAVPSWSLPQQLIALESKVLEFQADAVWLVATPKDGEVAAHHLWNMIRRGYEVPFDYLQRIAAQAGVQASTTEADAVRRLRPYEDEIVRETYARFASIARARGVTPVWVYLSLPGHSQTDILLPRLREFARSAGFTELDLSRVYTGHDIAALKYAEWDEHPNARGHQIIAQGIFDALQTRSELLGVRAAGSTPVVDPR